MLGKIIFVGFGPAQGAANWHAMIIGWAPVLAILALCAYATRSFHYFENNVLLVWAVVTPLPIASIAAKGQHLWALVIMSGRLIAYNWFQ